MRRTLSFRPLPDKRKYPVIKIRGEWRQSRQEMRRWDPAIALSIEMGWFATHEKQGHHGRGALRHMPYEDWNRLIDCLPICECGRPVAPIRAKKGRFGATNCSPQCKRRKRKRMLRRRERLQRYEARREAQNLAESIGQE